MSVLFVLQAIVKALNVKSSSLPTLLSALGYIALLKPEVFKPQWFTVIDEFTFKQLLMVVRVCRFSFNSHYC